MVAIWTILQVLQWAAPHSLTFALLQRVYYRPGTSIWSSLSCNCTCLFRGIAMKFFFFLLLNCRGEASDFQGTRSPTPSQVWEFVVLINQRKSGSETYKLFSIFTSPITLRTSCPGAPGVTVVGEEKRFGRAWTQASPVNYSILLVPSCLYLDRTRRTKHKKRDRKECEGYWEGKVESPLFPRSHHPSRSPYRWNGYEPEQQLGDEQRLFVVCYERKVTKVSVKNVTTLTNSAPKLQGP